MAQLVLHHRQQVHPPGRRLRIQVHRPAPAVGGRIDGELVAVEHGRPEVVAGQVDDVGLTAFMRARSTAGRPAAAHSRIAAASAALSCACVSGTTPTFGPRLTANCGLVSVTVVVMVW